jgi:7,8-dihydropterin-6-yl-methyl-4-(beta-D-ribofuranosyl)aminobenzene 5'-phosphate synthase
VPDALVAEHGFSMLITVRKGGRTHRILFDTGASPDGVVANMRRLDVGPGSIEAIICSHGHFDHTTGLDGLARALGRRNMPVLIHPHFWRQRRVAIPGREPVEIPTVSRRGLEEIGFSDHREPPAQLPARRVGPGHRRGTLWGSRTRPPDLTWASTRLARIR